MKDNPVVKVNVDSVIPDRSKVWEVAVFRSTEVPQDELHLTPAEALGRIVGRRAYRFAGEAEMRAFLLKEGFDACEENVARFSAGYVFAFPEGKGKVG